MSFRTPIGLHLSATAKAASRAFDDALGAAGGSRPTWLIMISLKSRRVANQRELAEAVGIQGATLTHHLNGMEKAGLLTRRRDDDNRRVHVVELTPSGEELFLRLREAAIAFDARLRGDIAEQDAETFERVLAQMDRNLATSPDPS